MSRGSRLRLRRLLAVGWTALFTTSLLLTVTSGVAIAADSSNAYAGSLAGDNEWTGGADALGAPNGTFMTATADNVDQGFGDFGISIPAGSVIDGVTVTVTAASTDNSGCQLSVRLSGNAGAAFTDRKTVNLTSTLSGRVFGSSADRWTWTDPDWDPPSIGNAAFRVEVRNEDPGAACAGTTSVDAIGVVVTYRTIDNGTANGPLSDAVCDKADFNFVIDMSGSIGVQGSNPSNLPDLKAGISAFVASFQAAGGDGIYSGTRFNGSSATALTSGYDSAEAFLADVDALSSPSGSTPTASGISTGAANDAGDRAGVRNIMLVITDGSPNVPTGGTGTGEPNTWFTAANAAIDAADAARGSYVVKSVYLSTPGDPGDTGLPFSGPGDAQWAARVMTEIGGGAFLLGDFSSFVDELYEAIGCPPPAPEVQVTKTADPTSVPEPGDDVEFTVTVHNQTAKSVTLDSLVDDVYGDLDDEGTCDTGISLDPGQEYVCTFTAPVTGDAGDTHHDTVTASISNADGSAEDSDDATVDVTDVEPTVQIVKTATPGSRPEPGGVFTYTLEITNTSPEDVVITALADDQATLSAECLALIGDTLTPDQTVSCSFTDTHTGVDEYTNVAAVTVVDDEQNEGSDTDDETVEVTDIPPTVTIDKSVDDAEKPEPGGVFTYTLKITNTSAEPVTITALTDDHALSQACLDLVGDVLAPGASTSCTYEVSYTDAGTYPNSAAVTVEDDEGTDGSDEDEESVTVTDVLPTVTLDKVVVGDDSLAEPGGSFSFELTITNTSVETVTIDELTDSNALSQDCLDLVGDSLAPGASVSCQYQVAHADPGTYPNTADVTVSDDEDNEASDTDEASVEVTDVPPTVELDKSVDDDSKPEPGGTFTFTLIVRNLSDEAVTITALTDDHTLSQDCLDLIGQELAPAGETGDSLDCSYEVDHLVPGTFENTATVTVTDDDGSTGDDEDDETVVVVDVDPSVTVVKTATPSSLPEPGGAFSYDVSVTNGSDETVWLTSLTDTKFGDLDGLGTCVADGTVAIAVGATYGCSFLGAVSGNAGFSHQNTVVAIVVDDEGSDASNFDDEVVTITDVPPTITVDKTATPETVFAGATVTFDVTVVNESDEAVTLTSLTDSIYGDLDGQGTCALPQALEPDASYHCAFEAVVTATETDVVTASAVDDDGTTDEDDDDATVTVRDAEFTVFVTAPECDGDVPYLSYELAVVGTESDTATITFVHPSDPSQNVVYTDQPLSGRVLWPGAIPAGEPGGPDWPAWSLVDGVWVEGDEFDWVRPSVTVTISVNPESTVTVAYPPSTPTCNTNPPPPTLEIDKSNDAPIDTIELPDGSTVDLPTAEVGSTVTYTLAYTVSPDSGVSGATITDVLPAGLDYVAGSATGNAEFTFQGYDAASRTLSWSAPTATVSGSVTYEATIAEGADEIVQPLRNVATIDSDQTEPDADDADVYVPTEPAAATGTPQITLPPTDAIAGDTGTTSSGAGLSMALAALAILAVILVALQPVRAAQRAGGRRDRR